MNPLQVIEHHFKNKINPPLPQSVQVGGQRCEQLGIWAGNPSEKLYPVLNGACVVHLKINDDRGDPACKLGSKTAVSSVCRAVPNGPVVPAWRLRPGPFVERPSLSLIVA